MSEYEQIVVRAKEQNIDLENRYIVIPGCDENKFSLNGSPCFGRIFEDTAMVVLLRDVDSLYSDIRYIKEPFIYRIVNKCRTYLPNSLGHYLVEFYVVE